MLENNCSNKEEIILLTPNGAKTLYLTENDKPFPPKDYKGEGDCRYEYKNVLRFWWPPKNRYYPYRLFIKDIEIENGKITFFFENDEPPLIIESRFLMSTFRTGSEVSSPDKYESFWGKKSILKHHFKHVYPTDESYHWKNEVDSYYTNIITESLHDGVTSFTICYDEEFEDEWEYLELPDGVYNRDGVKLAENGADFDKRYPDLKYDNIDDDDYYCEETEIRVADDDIPF